MAGLHVDAINGRDDVAPLVDLLPAGTVLSLGVINGRNIWKTDLTAVLDWLEPIAERLGDRGGIRGDVGRGQPRELRRPGASRGGQQQGQVAVQQVTWTGGRRHLG